MPTIEWDQVGSRRYETGVDHGVLYLQNNTGAYVDGYAWNGLTNITESPSGAESNPQYADNIKYVDLQSAEEYGGTIEALTYPDEFEQCDGTATVNGVQIGQQSRKPFGVSYRTRVGNDIEGDSYGFKIHLVYGAKASPSEKGHSTVNDSPEATAFSWEFSTTPAPVGTIDGREYAPTATLTVDSTRVSAAEMTAFLGVIYGDADTDPRLPPPDEVIDMFTTGVTA